jgi:hypothetical protein
MLVALAVATLLGVVPASSAVAVPPYGVNILSSSTYVDALDNLHVVGEVANNTRFPVEFVQIKVNYFDTADVLLGSDSTYVGVDTLDPGQKAPSTRSRTSTGSTATPSAPPGRRRSRRRITTSP